MLLVCRVRAGTHGARSEVPVCYLCAECERARMEHGLRYLCATCVQTERARMEHGLRYLCATCVQSASGHAWSTV